MNRFDTMSPRHSESTVTVLSVSPSAEAQNRYDALRRLRDMHPAVVVCEHKLPDGGWQDLLNGVLDLPTPPNVIVTAPDADDVLWSDVLNRGGYDVLARPFDRAEVVRIISLAWMNWKQTYRRAPMRESTPLAMPTSA
jgi:FixJ family two-component response regulator